EDAKKKEKQALPSLWGSPPACQLGTWCHRRVMERRTSNAIALWREQRRLGNTMRSIRDKMASFLTALHADASNVDALRAELYAQRDNNILNCADAVWKPRHKATAHSLLVLVDDVQRSVRRVVFDAD
ncbi:MAG: hypothetical protein ABEI52_11590, partial [Halobacteriaceae archaeon]